MQGAPPSTGRGSPKSPKASLFACHDILAAGSNSMPVSPQWVLDGPLNEATHPFNLADGTWPPTTLSLLTLPWKHALQARDPIPAFRKWALEEGLFSEGKIKDLEQSVLAEVEDAVQFADESPKPVSACVTDAPPPRSPSVCGGCYAVCRGVLQPGKGFCWCESVSLEDDV